MKVAPLTDDEKRSLKKYFMWCEGDHDKIFKVIQEKFHSDVHTMAWEYVKTLGKCDAKFN